MPQFQMIREEARGSLRRAECFKDSIGDTPSPDPLPNPYLSLRNVIAWAWRCMRMPAMER